MLIHNIIIVVKYSEKYFVPQNKGTVERIVPYFDSNGNGDMSYFEFETGLKNALGKEGMDCFRTMVGAENKDVSVKRLFGMFDKSGDGTIDTMELMGIDMQEVETAQWELLSTMQQWKVWCKHTSAWAAEKEAAKASDDRLGRIADDFEEKYF